MAIIILISEGENNFTLNIDRKSRIIGRSSKSDIKLTDSHVSGQHLALKVSENGSVLVKDLGSTNGTYLNQNAVIESRFRVNDIITIGPNVKITINKAKLTKGELDRIEVNHNPINLSTGLDRQSSENATLVMKQERKQKTEVKVLKPNQSEATSLKEETAIKKEENEKSSGRVNENFFDLEESSGQTRMIKIERKKPQIQEKTKKKKLKKEDQDEESTGIKDKILSFFKK